MLKFNTWPPQPGEVEFTEVVSTDFYERFNVCMLSDMERVSSIGRDVGSLLFANIPEPSFEKVTAITSKLIEKWGEDSQDRFMRGLDRAFEDITESQLKETLSRG